jgi:hypothetical protein
MFSAKTLLFIQRTAEMICWPDSTTISRRRVSGYDTTLHAPYDYWSALRLTQQSNRRLKIKSR